MDSAHLWKVNFYIRQSSARNFAICALWKSWVTCARSIEASSKLFRKTLPPSLITGLLKVSGVFLWHWFICHVIVLRKISYASFHLHNRLCLYPGFYDTRKGQKKARYTVGWCNFLFWISASTFGMCVWLGKTRLNQFFLFQFIDL